MGAQETPIQSAILNQLLWRKIFAWRNQRIPTPIRRGREIKGFRKADPQTVGMPDIIAVINGRFIGIEVKSATGKQEPEQVEWQAKLERAGGQYILARSWEDVAAALNLKP